MRAVRASIENIRRFSKQLKIESVRLESEGVLVEEWVTPLSRVGIYVPEKSSISFDCFDERGAGEGGGGRRDNYVQPARQGRQD